MQSFPAGIELTLKFHEAATIAPHRAHTKKHCCEVERTRHHRNPLEGPAAIAQAQRPPWLLPRQLSQIAEVPLPSPIVL
jgi:hypothetical protein